LVVAFSHGKLQLRFRLLDCLHHECLHLSSGAPLALQAMFDTVSAGLTALGMRVSIQRVQPHTDDVLDIKQTYEGGYVMIAIDHADAPANDWHRPDLFA